MGVCLFTLVQLVRVLLWHFCGCGENLVSMVVVARGCCVFLSAKFVQVHCTFLLYVCMYRLYYFLLCYHDGCGLVSNCLLL